MRPSGFEPPTFCSGEKSSMCMLFILQSAQRGCERELRGIQRLLCILLCTRSNSYRNPVHPSALRRCETHVCLSPLLIVGPFCERTGPFGEIEVLFGAVSF